MLGPPTSICTGPDAGHNIAFPIFSELSSLQLACMSASVNYHSLGYDLVRLQHPLCWHSVRKLYLCYIQVVFIRNTYVGVAYRNPIYIYIPNSMKLRCVDGELRTTEVIFSPLKLYDDGLAEACQW